MKALIDGDILRYEVGFGAEMGWRAITENEDALPSFDYVEEFLLKRINEIVIGSEATDGYILYISEGASFRNKIAVTKPYKGTRVSKKPWHFNNLTEHMKSLLNAQVVKYIEADDALSIEHYRSNHTTVLCSRDKDLRQVPGWFYSWELGKQPSFGPYLIDDVGKVEKTEKGISGIGYAFFCSQLLTGDSVDNIPGLPKYGPVKAVEILEGLDTEEELYEAVRTEYEAVYSEEYEEKLLEQGRLCWMTRRLNGNGSPELWELGQLR